jgi:single-strand DNA-binding protein
MLNKSVLIGRLTKDVDLRYTPNGVAVANFSLAVDRNFTNQQGEKETDFIEIVSWRKTAENCAYHIGKGRLVAVDGRIEQQKWSKDGKNYSKLLVVADSVQFLDFPKDKQNNGGNAGNFTEPVDLPNDDLPF